MTSDLHIRLDAVSEALLGAVAERNRRTPEEEAARLLAQELQRAAQECVDLDYPEEALSGTARDKH